MKYHRLPLASVFYAITTLGLVGCALFVVVLVVAGGTEWHKFTNPGMAFLAGAYGVFVVSGAALSCLFIAAAGSVIDHLARIAHNTDILREEVEERRAKEQPKGEPSPVRYGIPGIND